METENNGGIQVIKEAEEVLRTALQKARECNEEHTLLRIPFMTLFEYLQVGPFMHPQTGCHTCRTNHAFCWAHSCWAWSVHMHARSFCPCVCDCRITSALVKLS